MYNSFLSVVSVVDLPQDVSRITPFLEEVYGVLNANFSDFEIILVNNTSGVQLSEYITPLPAALKKNVFLLNLSSKINRNHAIVAGLDRANGDYTLIFEFDFFQSPQYILQLFQKSQTPFDIVYLRAQERKVRFMGKILYQIFYGILKNYSSLRVDEKAHDTRIISRRALNSLLRLRENLRYMKAIYSIVGYSTAFIEVDHPLDQRGITFSERFRTSLVAISSYTSFLRTLLLWIFFFSLIFLFGVIFNALKLKFTGVDLFGNIEQAMPGWTFLVVMIAIFFAITCLNLYIMSIYLSNIYYEIKQRPLYMIESIQRF